MKDKKIWKIVKLIVNEFKKDLAKGDFDNDIGWKNKWSDWQYGDFIVEFKVREVFNAKKLKDKPFKRKGKIKVKIK